MARVVFTSNLQRHVSCPDTVVTGGTVREALEHVFSTQPQVRSYVLDEQGDLRKHVFIFVDGRRVRLADPVRDSSEIHVLQALTGG
jgi:molybdopterin converting factor small subunit